MCLNALLFYGIVAHQKSKPHKVSNSYGIIFSLMKEFLFSEKLFCFVFFVGLFAKQTNTRTKICRLTFVHVQTDTQSERACMRVWYASMAAYYLMTLQQFGGCYKKHWDSTRGHTMVYHWWYFDMGTGDKNSTDTICEWKMHFLFTLAFYRSLFIIIVSLLLFVCSCKANESK